MTTKYAANSRQVVIERGSKGFGFTLKRPLQRDCLTSDTNPPQTEPFYTFGAQVRSVEDLGPARRGGLLKDEYVVTVNKETVRGKTYLDIMKIILATSRSLILEVANPPSWSEANIGEEESVEGDGNERAMEEAVAEKENQAVLQFNPASPCEPVLVPPSTSVSVILPPRSATIFSNEESQRIIREFDQCARDHSDVDDEDEDSLSYRRSHIQVRATQSSLSPSSGLGHSKAIGLARSTGHLEQEQDPHRPTVTFKKAYHDQHASPSNVSLHYSVLNSQSGDTPRRTSLGVGTQGMRPTAEPRINFKKRKSGNSGGMGANYSSTPSVVAAANSSSFRAHSVSHLPHNLLAGTPTTVRHHQPPNTTTSSTLMHSPMRRGSSPARSAGVTSSGPIAPLSGVEEFDNSIPTSPTNSATSMMHETRFSLMPDKVTTYRWTGGGGGGRSRADEMEGRRTVSPSHSALQLQPQDLSISPGASSSPSILTSTSVTSSSSTSTTINIQRVKYRNPAQVARQQFMTSQPIPPPPLPVSFVTPPSISSTNSPQFPEQNTSVLRRESYINAVKTRTTLFPVDPIAEREEQDEDSVIEDVADGQGNSTQKMRHFFGESWSRRSARNKTPKIREAMATSGTAPCYSEKKFNLNVKVIREDGKETKSKSWKSFTLTIENDVMHLVRERKESSASSSSSAEEMSPIHLRQCHFEWPSSDQARKKYLVCRMYVNPPSPPPPHDSTSSSSSAPPLSLSAPSTAAQPIPSTSSGSLHTCSQPSEPPGVSEYKLQFSNAKEMQAFCRCLPESKVTNIGGPADLTATYPPPAKGGKKLSKVQGGGRLKKEDLDMMLLDPALIDSLLQPASNKPKLLNFMRNIRWKSSSTEGSSTTTTVLTTKWMRSDEMRTMSPGEVSKPLPGATFGVSLMQVPRSSFSQYVPLVVELCTRIVETCGMHCVGVYRVSAKKAVIDALEAELNECGGRLEHINRSNERWNDVHAVGGLLKCFLRKMPDPVFPFGLYSQFLEASDRRLPHERKMLQLQRLFALMDSDTKDVPEYKYHRETLKYLAQHLHRVASHSHINKMTTKNLVSMIAPNVFRPPGDSNVTLLMQATAQGATILELVVHYHEWLFSTEVDAGCDVPPPLPTDPGPSIVPVEHCAGEHDTGEAPSHSNDEALGGAEDRGRNIDVHFRTGEKATDVLAVVLDSAIAVQEKVDPEVLTSLDEGGFDEVDIDAAVKRRQQMDEAAAAAAAASVSVSTTSNVVSFTSTSNASSSSSASSNPVTTSSASTLIAEATFTIPVNTNASSNSVYPAPMLIQRSANRPRYVRRQSCFVLLERPIAEETDNFSFPSERRGSASLLPTPLPSSDWPQLHQRAEEHLKRDGGRWFGAAAVAQPGEREEVPGPPLPPRRYDAEMELQLRRQYHAKQMSKSLDSLHAQAQASGRSGQSKEGV